MTQTHTQGPWHTSDDDRMLDTVCDQRGHAVARVMLCRTGAASNIHLVAAAPDLLEALANLVAHFGANLTHTERKHAEEARAAIAKARGQSVNSVGA